jgi:flagellar assembly protein FliH
MSSSAPKRQRVFEAEPLAYPEAECPIRPPGSGAEESAALEERSQRHLAEAFERGCQSARESFREEVVSVLDQHRDQVLEALRKFAVERQDYYRRVEVEVVQLSLAIARKVLHREVQIDPQALAGIVKVTLEKLDRGTKVDLRVHPREVSDWRHYFSRQMEGDTSPEVHEDPSVAPGECRIETSLGSTDLGLESQLKEIETGLLDLLAERPETSANPDQLSNPRLSNSQEGHPQAAK